GGGDRHRGHRSGRRVRDGSVGSQPGGGGHHPRSRRGTCATERAHQGLQTMKLPPGVEEARVSIQSDTDIVTARQRGRMLATQLGFTSGDATIVATAISELARNIVLYAKGGEVLLTPVESRDNYGLVITARDEGEGIAD